MPAKRVVPRLRAQRDTEAAVDFYLQEAGSQVAIGFVDALEQAYSLISEYPSSGSPRYAYELGLPNLRSCVLTRYPFLIFYVEGLEHIDVWRVLHAHRDLPAWLQEPETGHTR